MLKRAMDLSHPLAPGMSLYPGSRPLQITPTHTMESDGSRVSELTLNTHLGTHLDAPRHMLPQGESLSDLPLTHFFGPGLVVDCSSCKSTIFLEHFQNREEQIRAVDFLLLHTGYSRFWGRDEYLGNFPVLSPKAAEWLTGCHLKGLGVDAISVDPLDSTAHPVHKILLEHQLVIIENLGDLSSLVNQSFFFQCLPLPIPGLDGSPTRALAFLD